MTKEFAVPPVDFTGGSTAGANFQQRRAPAAPYQAPRPSSASSSIPFMSFDAASAAASAPAGPFGGTISSSSSFGGGGGGGGYASFEDEELLPDELVIHPDQIWRKTRSILNPFRINQTAHKDSDLSGPIFLYLALCLFQLLAGKIQFGVILGWVVVSSIFLYIVFNMLAGRNGNLNLHTCTSLVGYSLGEVWLITWLQFGEVCHNLERMEKEDPVRGLRRRKSPEIEQRKQSKPPEEATGMKWPRGWRRSRRLRFFQVFSVESKMKEEKEA